MKLLFFPAHFSFLLDPKQKFVLFLCGCRSHFSPWCGSEFRSLHPNKGSNPWKSAIRMPYNLACHLQIDAESDPVPDPAYHFDADPDVDPDPDFYIWCGSSVKIKFFSWCGCGSGSRLTKWCGSTARRYCTYPQIPSTLTEYNKDVVCRGWTPASPATAWPGRALSLWGGRTAVCSNVA